MQSVSISFSMPVYPGAFPRPINSAGSPSTIKRWRCSVRTSVAASEGCRPQFQLPPEAWIFSLSPDGSTCLKPDSVTQRYSRMCARLG